MPYFPGLKAFNDFPAVKVFGPRRALSLPLFHPSRSYPAFPSQGA